MLEKQELGNGLKVIVEEIPHVKSVTIGLWILAGSSTETVRNNGVFHFMEHLIFKGTNRRNAQDIAEALESVGGHLNAFSSKEYTCYYVKVTEEHFELAMDVLADITLNSRFPAPEIEKEKQVVMEEIKMYQDSPDEIIHDRFAQALWKDSPLGYPILGRNEVIGSLTRRSLMRYYRRYYNPANMILSVAGSVTVPQVVNVARSLFGDKKGCPVNVKTIVTNSKARTDIEPRKIEQVHLCMGREGVSQTDNRRFPLILLNTILGGGMSSRLFQEVREKRGLAYSIFSYQSSYKDTGLFSIYAGSSPRNLKLILELVMETFDNLRSKGVTEKENDRAKAQLKGNLILNLENTAQRMTHMARLEIYHGRFISLDELIDKIESVTRDDILSIADWLLKPDNLTTVAIGPVKSKDFKSFNLA